MAYDLRSMNEIDEEADNYLDYLLDEDRDEDRDDEDSDLFDDDDTDDAARTVEVAVVEAAPPVPIGDRLTSAVQLGALMTVALFIMGQLAERLRPEEHLDRGIVDTPFLWAIVIWIVTLLFHALAFEESQIRHIEREPLMAGLAVGGLLLVVGLFSTEGASFTDRFYFVFANALGAVLFWWAMFSLGSLILRRVRI